MSPQVLPPTKILFRKVFGSGPMIFWLLPCDINKSNQMLESQDMYHV